MTRSQIGKLISGAKKVIPDFAYNIMATIMHTAVLQILIYPVLAASFGAEEYGYLLTIMGIVNIITVSLGNSLNNVRLIQNSKYQKQKLSGDFNLLIMILSGSAALIFGMVLAVWEKGLHVETILLMLCIVVGSLVGYWGVAYRLKINYKKILVYNIIRCVGYLVGVVLSRKLSLWPLSFLAGEGLGLVFLLKTTSLPREKMVRTPLFSHTLKSYVILIGTSVASNLVLYLDRIFLYPILGGEQVTVYTVSSFAGKSIGLLVSPMAGVLLSYYAQDKFRMTVRRFWAINAVIILGGSLVGMVAILAAPWITGILYPTVVDRTAKYIMIANVGAIVAAFASIISPSVLKFAHIGWQMVIQIVYMASYISFGYVLLLKWGLYGFCIATLTVNVIRLLLYMLVGHFSIVRKSKYEYLND